MLLLPPGQGKKKEFSTSYIIFEKLLIDLYENRLSGYLRLNFWGYEGILILDTGKIIQAYSSEPDAYLTGEQAVLRLLEKANEKDGEVDIFFLDNQVATCLAFSLQAELYKNEKELAGITFSEILAFVEKENLTGYADLQFSEKRGTGTLYFLEGLPVETVIMSSSGKIASGMPVLERFQRIGKLVQPLCRIYRVDNPSPIIEDAAFIIPWKHGKFMELWAEVLKYFRSRLNRKIFKKDFSEILTQVLTRIFENYPDLRVVHNKIDVSPTSLLIKSIIPREQFLKFIGILFKSLHQKLPNRKRENRAQYLLFFNKLVKKYEIDSVQFNASKFLDSVFSGEGWK